MRLQKHAFYYINKDNLDFYSGLQTLMTCHFKVSSYKKELYTSKESPITSFLKEVLKLDEVLPWDTQQIFTANLQSLAVLHFSL